MAAWAHLQQTGPEAALWVTVAAVAVVGGYLVGELLESIYRAVRR